MKLFNPQNIALIGATNTKGKPGYAILKNLIDSKFKGKIFPINPKHSSILGKKCYPSLDSIKTSIDSAVIVIPKQFVEETLIKCGEAKIKTITIISSGFKEVGDSASENKLLNIAKKYKMRIIGPNCFGLINTAIGLNTTFSDSLPLKGNVGFISQSGAICSAILDWSKKHKFGFSKFISLGNESDINEVDVLLDLMHDKNTKIILMYAENIKDPRKFLEVAKKVTSKKPIIILKSGRTTTGAKAALSHTGSISGNDAYYDALFSKANVIRVNDLANLFHLSELFSNLKGGHEKNIAIITNSGGPGVICADAIHHNGLALPQFSANTIAKLKKVMPAHVPIKNPLDIIGDADDSRYKKALSIIGKDKIINTIIVITTPLSSINIDNLSKSIISEQKKINKTIIPCFLGGEKAQKGISLMEEHGITVSATPNTLIPLLQQARTYFIKKNEKLTLVGSKQQSNPYDNNILSESQARKLLAKHQVSLPLSTLVKTSKEAVREAKKMKYPIVLKIDSSEIQHKTESKVIKVGVNDDKELKKSFSEIVKNYSKLKNVSSDGMTVMKQVSGYELVIGINKDANFGHILTFGLGGIYVELYKDVVQTMLPVSKHEIRNLINQTKFSKILNGYRGMEKANMSKLVDDVYKLCKMAESYDLKSLEINPYIINSKKGNCVDVIMSF